MPSPTLAAVLVDELIRCGVAHAVLCPGSRSAPLAYALDAADAAGRLRLHVRVDERVAGFVALGLAKGTGRVVPVVTTSGTAVANLHPAILEADASGVPLLALTADRPPELRGAGANQTTDQVKLFGAAVRWWHELGTPYGSGASAEGASPAEAAEEVLAHQAAAWRTAADRAVAAAIGMGGRPGPVHVNVPLREPLAPAVPSGPAVVPPAVPTAVPTPVPTPVPQAAALTGRPRGKPWTETSPAHAPQTHVFTLLNETLTDQPRTLVLLGDLSGAWGGRPLGADLTSAYRTVLRWAASAGFPVLAEPFGPRGRGPGAPARSGAGAPGAVPQWPDTVLPHSRLLSAATELVPGLAPRRILVIGRLTLSRQVGALLRRPDTEIVVLGGGARWADPSHAAHRVLDLPWAPEARTSAASTAPPATPESGPGDPGWLQAWRAAAGAVSDAVAPCLAGDFPLGPSVAATVLDALPPGSRLFLGSSAVPRDAELVRGNDAVDVWASRGLAGIDGCLSTAVGLSLAAPGLPTYALVGDLTFLHDGNALLIGTGEPVPDLTVVVVNDDGGAIFGTLEYGEPGRIRDPAAAATLRRAFTAPTGADLAARCAAHGVRHRAVTSAAELAEAVGRRPVGLSVVEVAAHGADRRAHEARVAALAAQALRSLGSTAPDRGA